MIERREDTKYGDDRIGYLVRRECIATQLFAGMLAQHNVVNPVFAYQSPTPQLAIHFADLLIEALDSDARSSPVHEPIAENAEKQGVS